MAFTERYANFDLGTGSNNGTSEANAWQTPAAVIAGVAAGDRVNIKKQSSRYPVTSTLTFSTAGTATAPIWYRGYETTIGDGGRWQVNQNTNGAHLVFSGAYSIIDSIDGITGSSAHNFDITGTNNWLINSIYEQNGTSNPAPRNMYNCLFKLGRARITLGGTNSANSVIKRCVFTRNSANGPTAGVEMLNIALTNRAVVIDDCIFWGDGLTDINAIDLEVGTSNRFCMVSNCRFYNVNHGVNIDVEPDAVREEIHLIRNVFSTMAGYAIYRNGASYLGYVSHQENCFHACTSGFTNYPDEATFLAAISMSASPFENAASGDFTLNDNASGGALARAIGIPIHMPISPSTGAVIETYEGTGGGGGGWGFRRRARLIGA